MPSFLYSPHTQQQQQLSHGQQQQQQLKEKKEKRRRLFPTEAFKRQEERERAKKSIS